MSSQLIAPGCKLKMLERKQILLSLVFHDEFG